MAVRARRHPGAARGTGAALSAGALPRSAAGVGAASASASARAPRARRELRVAMRGGVRSMGELLSVWRVPARIGGGGNGSHRRAHGARGQPRARRPAVACRAAPERSPASRRAHLTRRGAAGAGAPRGESGVWVAAAPHSPGPPLPPAARPRWAPTRPRAPASAAFPPLAGHGGRPGPRSSSRSIRRAPWLPSSRWGRGEGVGVGGCGVGAQRPTPDPDPPPVLLSLLQQRADAYLAAVRSSPDAARACAARAADPAAPPEVRFWCLQTAHAAVRRGAHAAAAPGERAALRAEAARWLAAPPPGDDPPAFVRNKAAQLLAALAAADFPGEWPSLFDDAVAALEGGGGGGGAASARAPPPPPPPPTRSSASSPPWTTTSSRWTSPGRPPTRRRRRRSRAGCERGRCRGWSPRCSRSRPPTRPPPHPSPPPLCKPLPAWPAGATPAWWRARPRVRSLASLLPPGGPVASAAGAALAAIASKRMEAPAKLALLRERGVAAAAAAWAGAAPRGARARLLATVASEALDAWARVEGGVAALGACGLAVPADAVADAEAACAAASALLDAVVPPLIRSLPPMATAGDGGDGDDGDDSNGDGGGYAAAAFLAAYVSRLRSSVKRGGALPAGDARGHVAAILAACAAGARWPVGALPNGPAPGGADAEEAAAERRHELFSLLRAAASLDSGAAAAAASAALAAALAPGAGAPFEAVEIAIATLFHLGEGAPEASMRLGAPLGDAARALARSSLPHARHRLVAASLLECHVRYAKAFQFHDEGALAAAAAAFVGASGGAHAHAPTAARAAYLFARFARALRQPLLAHLEGLLPALGPLLAGVVDGAGRVDTGAGAATATPLPSRPDDRLYLFEAAGVLLGQAELAPGPQLAALRGLVDPLLAAVASSLPAASDPSSPAADAAAARTRAALDALARASRGFAPALVLRARPALGAALAPAADAALAVLTGAAGSSPGARALRARAASLLHRLADCLGDGLLPLLPTAARALLRAGGSGAGGGGVAPTAADVVDAASLLAQLASQYGAAAAPLMAAALPDVTAAAGALLPPGCDWSGAGARARARERRAAPRCEAARERDEVRGAMLALAHALASARLGAVAVAAGGGLVDALLAAAEAHVDPPARRACLASVRRLAADAAAARPPAPGLAAFLAERVAARVCLGGLLAGLAAPARGGAPAPDAARPPPALDPRDAAVAALVGDAARLLVDAAGALAALGAPPLDAAALASAAGLPPAAAAALGDAVAAGDVKGARAALRGGMLALAGVLSSAEARARVAAAREAAAAAAAGEGGWRGRCAD